MHVTMCLTVRVTIVEPFKVTIQRIQTIQETLLLTVHLIIHETLQRISTGNFARDFTGNRESTYSRNFARDFEQLCK